MYEVENEIYRGFILYPQAGTTEVYIDYGRYTEFIVDSLETIEESMEMAKDYIDQIREAHYEALHKNPNTTLDEIIWLFVGEDEEEENA